MIACAGHGVVAIDKGIQSEKVDFLERLSTWRGYRGKSAKSSARW
jgi:hypothetical protein